MNNLNNYSFKKIFQGVYPLSNNIVDEIKNNTVKFILKPNIFTGKQEYILFGKKIFISAGYNHTNVSGTLEANISFRASLYKNTNELSVHHSKIDYISDTKIKKCFHIKFEQVNKDICLTIHYGSTLNSINVTIIELLPYFENNLFQSEPILTYEDISKIQEWY